MKKLLQKSVALLAAMLVLASCAGGTSKAVAKVNDVEISAETLEDWIEYYLNSSYMEIPADIAGLPDDEREQYEAMRDQALDYLIDEQVQLAKAKEDGLDKLSEEELATVDQEVKTTMNSWYDSITSEVQAEGELGGEELAAEVKKRYDEFIKESGYNTEYVTETIKKNTILAKLQEKYFAELEPTEEQIKAKYDETVAEEKERYAEDPDVYAEDIVYSTPLFHPAGFRRVSHILIGLTDEQNTELSNLQTEGNTEEYDKKQKEYMDEAKTRADEVYAELEEGKDFTAAMKEYTADLDYEGNPNQPEGYIINENSTNLVSEFVEGGMAIAKVGDYSQPIKTDYGYHILRYEEETKETTTPYEEVTEEMIDEFKNEILYDSYEALKKEWQEGMTVERYLENVVWPTPAPTPTPEAVEETPAATAEETHSADDGHDHSTDELAPTETTPAETEPADTTPASTEPAETTPAVSEPAESTPAE